MKRKLVLYIVLIAIAVSVVFICKSSMSESVSARGSEVSVVANEKVPQIAGPDEYVNE